MQLSYFKGCPPNFGDELNAWLWPRIFGDIWNDEDPEIFLGIGSILYDNHYPERQRKIVFGAGYGGYSAGVPDVHDGSWDIFFVRGPQTAEYLRLDPGLALTDAAILVRTQELPPPAGTGAVAFMPHFQSLDRGNWERVCAVAGITLIDPRAPVETVLGQIRGTSLLLTEAMHGAIVADALRVPWIALRPIVSQHHFKWHDWTRSVELDYRPVPMPPSSTREAWILAGLGRAKGAFSTALANGPVGSFSDGILVDRAARRLLQLADGRPSLSSDACIELLTGRAVAMVDRFREKYAPFQRPVAMSGTVTR